MKKQPSRAKKPLKTKAKAVTKTTKSAKVIKKHKTPVLTAKKTTKRKGLVHHTKRIYHLTPKFVHGALIGAFVGMLVVAWIGSTGNAHANPAADPCIKTNGPINVNLKNANVEVKTNDCNTNHSFVLKVWYAPAANGEPHEDQRLYKTSEAVVVKKNSNEWTKMNVFAPELLGNSCFYQVDLVDITNEVEGDGVKNPIVRAALGGSQDCTPKPEYSCNSMTVRQEANRTVKVDSFHVTEVNARLDHVVINWDFPNSQTTDSYNGSPVGAEHPYTQDGTFKIYAVAYFKITGKNGEENVKVAKQACTAEATFVPVAPGYQEVCELSTGKIVQIPEGPYATAQYGPPTAKECNVTITVTSSSTLTKTGPGAILTVLAFAAVGGYTFHRTHRHLTTRKARRAAK